MKRTHELVIGAAVTLAAAVFAFTLAGCNDPSGGAKTLSSIAVTARPTKTAYATGEALDTSGMTVTATYSDSSTAAVTGWTTGGFDSDTAGGKTVTVSYTEDGVTQTAAFTVTVSAGIDTTKMACINGGTFTMGSPENEPYRVNGETQHSDGEFFLDGQARGDAEGMAGRDGNQPKQFQRGRFAGREGQLV